MVSRGVLALGLAIVSLAGLLVPAAARAEWKREWGAELWHLHRSLGAPTPRREASFLLRAMGCLLDALQLRVGDVQAWSESAAAVLTHWGRHAPAVTVGLLFLSVGMAADTLLLAFGRVMLAAPVSPRSAGLGEGRAVILGIAVVCGAGLIMASAAAAAQLLALTGTAPRGARNARIVELFLIAGVTAWVALWLAAFGIRSVSPPHLPVVLSPAGLGGGVMGAWFVSWVIGLTLLVLVRSLRRDGLTG